MIISHSHKFVFVKTRKTASTSIEVFLHPNLTSDDIWTPLTSPAVAGNRYYSAWPFDLAAAKSAFVRRKLGKSSPFYFRYLHDHASLKDLYKSYGTKRFSSYFKFCFDRNPWDYVVSLYYSITRKEKGRTYDFDEFVYTYPIPINWTQYTIDDRIAVDAVFRYEEIDARLASLVERYGLVASDFPRLKSDRRMTAGYRSLFSPGTRDHVASRFSRVIDHFGYEF